jgi:hypothetical protein
MPNRQFTSPLVINRYDHVDSVSRLIPIRRDEHAFSELWFRDTLFDHPYLLPAAEIESAFHGLEGVAKELPLAGNFADLVFVNPDGCIALTETKLFRNPEAKREVLAQAIEYASILSGWTYTQFVQAIKQANKSMQRDPLVETMRKATQDGSFDEGKFIERVTRNLQLGRLLILIVGDEIRDEVERMVQFVHRTPHLHFTLGLIEIALFRESDANRIFVQPRLVAQTELYVRTVIEIRLPAGVEMRTEVKPERPGNTSRTSISEEQFFEELCDISQAAGELAKWAIAEAPRHQLIVDWGARGAILKFFDERGEEFNFGQLSTDGRFYVPFWLPRFRKLGYPEDIGIGYLDDIVRLVPGSARQERGFEKEVKTEVIVFPKGSKEYLPLAELARNKEKWFQAIDKAIGAIRSLTGKD